MRTWLCITLGSGLHAPTGKSRVDTNGRCPLPGIMMLHVRLHTCGGKTPNEHFVFHSVLHLASAAQA